MKVGDVFKFHEPEQPQGAIAVDDGWKVNVRHVVQIPEGSVAMIIDAVVSEMTPLPDDPIFGYRKSCPVEEGKFLIILVNGEFCFADPGWPLAEHKDLIETIRASSKFTK